MKKIKVLSLLFTICALVSLLSGCIGPGLEDYEYYVGTGYKLMRLNGSDIRVIPINQDALAPSGVSVPAIGKTVSEIAWDERYVLAKQEQGDAENYYILDTYDLELFGPYTLSEFEESRRNLGVSSDLVLVPPSSFRSSDVQIKDYQVGKGYNFHAYFPSDTYISASENGAIPFIKSRIIEVTWDERFILAKHSLPYSEAECYSILDAQKRVLYEYVTQDEFEAGRKKLNISKKLALEDVSKFLPSEPDSSVFICHGYELYLKEGDDVYVRPAGDIHRVSYDEFLTSGNCYPEEVAVYKKYILAKLSPKSGGSALHVIINTSTLQAFKYSSLDAFESARTKFRIPTGIKFKNVSDYLSDGVPECPLGNGYSLFQDKNGDARLEFKAAENIKYLSNYITYYYPELSDSGETVSELAWNKRYVLVKRLGMKRALPEEYKNAYKVPNEEDPHYYILDTVDHVLYGDYDLEAFNAKRQELGISDKLKLKSYLDYENSFPW